MDTGSTGTKLLIGAAAGAIGVWALDRVDWFLWRRMKPERRAITEAVRPNGEPPAEHLVTRASEALGHRIEGKDNKPLSLAAHYAIGIAPAALYALFRDRLPGRGVPRGLLYGGSMFLAQDEGLNAASGLGASPRRYPWEDHARGLIAHLVYGVVTELAVTQLGRRARALA